MEQTQNTSDITNIDQSAPAPKTPGKKKLFLVGIVLLVIIGVLYASVSNKNVKYTDPAGKFSIELPQGWMVQEVVQATSTSATWFSSPKVSDEDTSLKISVRRFERTPKVNNTMKFYTEEGFFQLIANDVKLGLKDYNQVSNATTSIQGVQYLEVVGTYIGVTSNKEVIQYLYIALTEDSYYLIGIDAYSDLWSAKKDEVLNSINTLKLF